MKKQTKNKGIYFFNTQWESINIQYKKKPSEVIRKKLKARGFRWSPTNKQYWKHVFSKASRNEAEQFAKSIGCVKLPF